MDKRSKAIKGLKCCAEFLCGECPYSKYQHIEYKLQCSYKMHQDLAEVLESKTVTRVKNLTGNYPDEFRCPVCGKFLGFVINHWPRHCSDCGTKIEYIKEEIE